MKWLCIVASLIWGSNVVLVKALLNQVSPFLMAFWRVLFSTGVAFGIAKLKKQSLSIEKGQIIPLIILGLFNVALNFSLSFIGMRMLEGTTTALFNALSPVFVSGLLFVFYHQRPSFENVLGIVLTLLGVYCALHFQLSQLNQGHWFLAASILCYAGSFLYAQKIVINPIVKTFYALLFGSFMLLGVNVYQGSLGFLDFSMGQWLLFLGISVLGFAFIQWIYFEASEKMNMSKVSFYMNLNPIFTYIGALLFLHEPLDFYQLGGIILILAGLLISKNKT